jgi:hypothetical protein
LQVWFLSWQTRVYARKPMPATPPGFFPQFIPDSNAPARERRFRVDGIIGIAVCRQLTRT